MKSNKQERKETRRELRKMANNDKLISLELKKGTPSVFMNGKWYKYPDKSVN